jgi:hypothetical protein
VAHAFYGPVVVASRLSALSAIGAFQGLYPSRDVGQASDQRGEDSLVSALVNLGG